MSNKVKLMESVLTKSEVIKTLALGVQQLSFDAGGEELVYATEAKTGKDTIIIECTDGSVVELSVKVKQ